MFTHSLFLHHPSWQLKHRVSLYAKGCGQHHPFHVYKEWQESFFSALTTKNVMMEPLCAADGYRKGWNGLLEPCRS